MAPVSLPFQGSFLLFYLNHAVSLCCGITAAYAIASVSPTMNVANAALPAYISTLLFFAGLFIPIQAIRPYWQWYAYINFMKYAVTSMFLNQFSGERNPRMFEGGQKTPTE